VGAVREEAIGTGIMMREPTSCPATFPACTKHLRAG
jgi:hypothetical protein